MTLIADIESWDGKTSDDIEAIYLAHHVAPDFMDSLLDLCRFSSAQRGAS